MAGPGSPGKRPRGGKPAAKGKSRPSKGDRTKETKDHQNTLQRINDFLKKSKPELKAAYRAASNKEKKDFQNVFTKCGSFDFIDKLKAHAEKFAQGNKKEGQWKTEDEISADFGLTEANAKTPRGQRALLKTKAVIDHCKKMGSKWHRPHPQHGDIIYKLLVFSDFEAQSKEEEVQTNFRSNGFWAAKNKQIHKMIVRI